MEAIIQCQARKNEIKKLKEEIRFKLYEIRGELLEESEEVKRIKREYEKETN